MIRDSGQFGSFDGLDNRKAVMKLFARMGDGIPDDVAAGRRAGFLQSLIGNAQGACNGLPLLVSPCTAVEAYLLFVAITGALGVPVETAARKLEDYIRRNYR